MKRGLILLIVLFILLFLISLVSSYSCETDEDCVFKNTPYCCGEVPSYFPACYHIDKVIENITCTIPYACPSIKIYDACGCVDNVCKGYDEENNFTDTCTKYSTCPNGTQVKKCWPQKETCVFYDSLQEACGITEDEIPPTINNKNGPKNNKNGPKELPTYIKEGVTKEECKTEVFTCPGLEGYINGLCHWSTYGTRDFNKKDGEMKILREECSCINATREEICENKKWFIFDKEAANEKERLGIIKSLENGCPSNCSCSGAVFKCPFEDTGREMTIYVGKSGKVIIQVKNEEGTPEIFIYEVGGETFRNIREEDKKEINILPEQASEIAREKIKDSLEEQKIEIEDKGFYKILSKKRAKLFGLFFVKEKVDVSVNIETGEVERVKTSWWGFLAKDIN